MKKTTKTSSLKDEWRLHKISLKAKSTMSQKLSLAPLGENAW